jgi:hypothetical protein
MALVAVATSAWAEEPPRVLLIVRERLRPGRADAYAENERRIAAVCARLGCPHPYLALESVAGPPEVWWLNAFASEREKDDVTAAHARNERLASELRPLGQRKEGFRQSLTTTLTKHRPDASGHVHWRVGGARFFVATLGPESGGASGVVFESPEGQRFVLWPAESRGAADRIAGQAAPGAIVLAVRPQWSFPDRDWIAADPDFWKASSNGGRP